MLTLRLVDVSAAEEVYTVTKQAFGEYYRHLSLSALEETIDDVRRDLILGLGLVGYEGLHAVASARMRTTGRHVSITRVGVVPGYRGRGFGASLVRAAETLGRDLGGTIAVVRTPESLPSLVSFYLRLGYVRSGRSFDQIHSYYDVTLSKVWDGE